MCAYLLTYTHMCVGALARVCIPKHINTSLYTHAHTHLHEHNKPRKETLRACDFPQGLAHYPGFAGVAAKNASRIKLLKLMLHKQPPIFSSPPARRRTPLPKHKLRETLCLFCPTMTSDEKVIVQRPSLFLPPMLYTLAVHLQPLA